ncbi:MAG: hypothetical protein R2849_04480 [Thermomicrobiales bacterium]
MLGLIGDIGWNEMTDWGGEFLSLAAERLVSVAIILVVTFIALRLLRSLVQRVVKQVLESRKASREVSQRASTLAALVESTGRYVIFFIAGITVLGTLGISLAPVLASAGIAGIAVAFRRRA